MQWEWGFCAAWRAQWAMWKWGLLKKARMVHVNGCPSGKKILPLNHREISMEVMPGAGLKQHTILWHTNLRFPTMFSSASFQTFEQITWLDMFLNSRKGISQKLSVIIQYAPCSYLPLRHLSLNLTVITHRILDLARRWQWWEQNIKTRWYWMNVELKFHLVARVIWKFHSLFCFGVYCVATRRKFLIQSIRFLVNHS